MNKEDDAAYLLAVVQVQALAAQSVIEHLLIVHEDRSRDEAQAIARQMIEAKLAEVLPANVSIRLQFMAKGNRESQGG